MLTIALNGVETMNPVKKNRPKYLALPASSQFPLEVLFSIEINRVSELMLVDGPML